MSLDKLIDHMVAIVSGSYANCVRLMIDCLGVIPFRLPDVALQGIDVAKRYWMERSVPASELEHARVACWNYLDERSASTNTENPEYCGIRAVICTLYPEPPSDDIGELVCFFSEMLRATVPHESDEMFFEAVSFVVERFGNNV